MGAPGGGAEQQRDWMFLMALDLKEAGAVCHLT
jgi:hypothetical protein